MKIFGNPKALDEPVIKVKDFKNSIKKLLEILEDPNVVVEDYMISKNAIVRTIKELFALHENDGVEHE